MELAGLRPDDFSDDVVEIWPEHWDAYVLFAYMRTQWRAGAMGVIGLDYGVLHRKMDRMDLGALQYDELEADIQVMEFAALNLMNSRDE
ncbi:MULTISPECIES: DUF1799 domain-containing protein [Massilia]|uniref:DUF1799 domain-containing protein n=1 Tax=Massilia haematophila TaxID=457923 RepID=A0ABV7PGX8_9BURK|nr:DUF1799 domain-containing protein [Massilia sp.]